MGWLEDRKKKKEKEHQQFVDDLKAIGKGLPEGARLFGNLVNKADELMRKKADAGDTKTYILTFSKGVVVYSLASVGSILGRHDYPDNTLEKKLREIFEANPRISPAHVERALGVKIVSVELRDDSKGPYSGIIIGSE